MTLSWLASRASSRYRTVMPAPLVVFDLDGTLVDTAPDLVDTLNIILTRENAPPVAFDEARTMIGGGALALLKRGLEASGQSASPENLRRLFADFLDHYAAHIADRSRPFPGCEAALDRLGAAGCRLAVCTNKLEWLSRKLLDELNLTHRFSVICGQDTFGVQKPDPAVWTRTVTAAGGDGARAVMVGDSETDIRLARAAGVPVVAVDFGYTETPIASFQPDRTIGHFNELGPAVEELLIAGAMSQRQSR